MVVWYAGVISLVMVVTIIVVSLFFALRSPSSDSSDNIISGLYKMRSVYFIVLSIAIVAVLSVTLSSNSIPYPGVQSGKPDTIINVAAKLWAWQLAAEDGGDLNISAGKEIEFRVSSDNVNHGFGIYNSSGQLLAQTQVMPGYINRLRYNFKKPGEYYVICMEYCGRAHQNMVMSFDVN